MQKLSFLLLLVFIISACSQENKEIPKSVQSKFEKKEENDEEKSEEKEGEESESEENEKAENQTGWMKSFDVEAEDFASVGANDYFILQPGYQLILRGKEEGKDVDLTITVLNETKVIDGVETRIVEERESQNGNLAEISRNYFAFDKEDHNVYYFGESVDIYKDGEIAGHEGAWESGKEGAKFGLMIPGKPELNAKYYQELAPETAMDRAEVVSVAENFETPAGKFNNCLKIEETTPLEPGVKEYKIYAPGIGLVQDGSLVLVKYGRIKK